VAAGEPSSLYYFSFVTLTTVGFGDVVPAAGTARTLVVVEALIGQIVLVTLVARLVSMQTRAVSETATNSSR
jgi:voltage-gated potassium channel Kch